MGREDFDYGERAARNFQQAMDRGFQAGIRRGVGPSSGGGYDPRVDEIVDKLNKVIRVLGDHLKVPHVTLGSSTKDKGLKQEVASLKSQLEDANKRITSLESTVQELKSQQRPEPAAPPLDQPKPFTFGVGAPTLGRPTFGVSSNRPTFGSGIGGSETPRFGSTLGQNRFSEAIERGRSEVEAEKAKYEEADTAEYPLKEVIRTGIDSGYLQKIPTSVVNAKVTATQNEPDESAFKRANSGEKVGAKDLILKEGEFYRWSTLTARIAGNTESIRIEFFADPNWDSEMLAIGLTRSDGRHEFNFVPLAPQTEKGYQEVVASYEVMDSQTVKDWYLPLMHWRTDRLAGDTIAEAMADSILKSQSSTPRNDVAWKRYLKKKDRGIPQKMRTIIASLLS